MTGGRLSAMHASPSSASSLSDGVRHRFARSKNIFGVPQPLFFKTTGQPTNFVKNRHRAKVALCSLLNHRLRRFARICLFWRSFSSGNCTPSNIRRHVRHVNAMKTPGNRRSPPRESSCPRAAKPRHPAAAGVAGCGPRHGAKGDLPTWPKSTGRQVAKSKKRNPATARKATPRRAVGQGADSGCAEGIGR